MLFEDALTATHPDACTQPLPPRRGAARRSAIPATILEELEAGRLETVTLVEWLAVDLARLLYATLPGTRLSDHTEELVAGAERLREVGVMERFRRLGEQLAGVLEATPEAYAELATHGSDVVRCLAASVVRAATLDPERRVVAVRRFARDRAMSVRELAWVALRDDVLAEPEASMVRLLPWVTDHDPNLRRCAVEATRPRGVWTRHCRELVADPRPGFPLLEPLRADPSRYVQDAVANWLNDASKSRPDLVREVCARWSEEPGTEYVVRRALRSLDP